MENGFCETMEYEMSFAARRQEMMNNGQQNVEIQRSMHRDPDVEMYY